jgi:hypothetical protein
VLPPPGYLLPHTSCCRRRAVAAGIAPRAEPVRRRQQWPRRRAVHLAPTPPGRAQVIPGAARRRTGLLTILVNVYVHARLYSCSITLCLMIFSSCHVPIPVHLSKSHLLGDAYIEYTR